MKVGFNWMAVLMIFMGALTLMVNDSLTNYGLGIFCFFIALLLLYLWKIEREELNEKT